MDDVTISAAGVDATIQLQSGMVTARFDVGGRSVEPLYTAPWRGWRGAAAAVGGGSRAWDAPGRRRMIAAGAGAPGVSAAVTERS